MSTSLYISSPVTGSVCVFLSQTCTKSFTSSQPPTFPCCPMSGDISGHHQHESWSSSTGDPSPCFHRKPAFPRTGFFQAWPQSWGDDRAWLVFLAPNGNWAIPKDKHNGQESHVQTLHTCHIANREKYLLISQSSLVSHYYIPQFDSKHTHKHFSTSKPTKYFGATSNSVFSSPTFLP